MVEDKYRIKKYADRKMYDVQTAKIIRLVDVINLVYILDKPLEVINVKGEDITINVLVDCYAKKIKNLFEHGRITDKLRKEMITELSKKIRDLK